MSHERSQTVEFDGQHFNISGVTGDILAGPFGTRSEAVADAKRASAMGGYQPEKEDTMPVTPVPQVPDPFGLMKQQQGGGGGLGGILGGGGGGGMDMSPLLMLLMKLFQSGGGPTGPSMAARFPGASGGGPAAPGATPIPAAPNFPQGLSLSKILGGGF